jgi:hypothetical protein
MDYKTMTYLVAEKSWKENRPKMVKELRRRGLLETAILHAEEMMIAEIDQRYHREGQQLEQAREAALLNWILLPPEKTHPKLHPDQMPYLEQGTTE